MKVIPATRRVFCVNRDLRLKFNRDRRNWQANRGFSAAVSTPLRPLRHAFWNRSGLSADHGSGLTGFFEIGFRRFAAKQTEDERRDK